MVTYEFLPKLAQNLMTAVRDMKAILEEIPEARKMTDLDEFDLNCLMQVMEFQHSDAELADIVNGVSHT